MATSRVLIGIITTAVFLGVSMIAHSATEERLKDEMGLTRLQILYPESGAEIDEARPMIGADASRLETPLDTQTVVITLNGADITDSAEITPAYIIYKPPEPLPPGRYEVRITAKDINRNDVEPLSWAFRIKGELPEEIIEEKRDNTTGRLVVSTDYVGVKYVPQSVVDVTQLFSEKEGMKLNTDLSFTNVSTGRTILGAYHRETQSYTDIEIDKGRLDYYDSHFNASLGHFWLSLSDLTVLGTELAGARIDKEDNSWSFTLFSGRTQDPSTSGTFKQLTSGLRSGYAWNRQHTSGITALAAWEKDGAATGSVTTPPARDEILSFIHEYQHDENTRATLEIARDARRERGSGTTHDNAAQLAVVGSRDAFTGELYAYDIGEDFYPVAEGSAKFLKNDREGYRSKGTWNATSFLFVGGEYEQYDTDSTDIRTKRGNTFVAVSQGRVQTLRYQKGKLVSNGAVSETDSVTAILLIPATANFTETRITAGWQDIDYSGSGVLTETRVRLFALNSSYRDRLGFSASYSESDTDNVSNVTTTENKNFSLGLNWNIIPFKLLWSGRYEKMNNSGTSVDNDEERIKTAFKYVLDDTYAFNLGWDTVNYSDTVSNVYNYDQSILRTGVEWSF